MVDMIAIESISSNICSASEMYYPATLYSDSEVGDGEVGDGEAGDGEVSDSEQGGRRGWMPVGQPERYRAD